MGSGGGGGGGGGGSGGDRSSKEAVGMMALHEALRNVCVNSDWTYSVFWTIRPRPRCRGGNGCKVGDDNGSLMLMWEDGFCRTRMAECLEEIDSEDPVRKAFSKMSIQLYNYGEGLMGKVASDKCHKWVFKEPSECEPNNISNYWQSSFDALPPEWTDQFACGIQTIAVIQAGHGLLQLGSCKIIPEDLHFVLRMRHMFESLGYQSGFFLSQLFSSTRANSPSSSSAATMKQALARPPPPLFNWTHPPLPSATQLPTPTFHHPSPHLGLPAPKDNTHLFLQLPHHPHPEPSPMEGMMPEHEPDLKWPNGLSFFTALTGRSDDAKLLFGGHEGLQMNICASSDQEANESNAGGGSNTEDYLGLESHSSKVRKMDNSGKFKRSFTMPARIATSSSSSSGLNQHQHQNHHQQQQQQGMEYRGSEAGIYSDIMETFLE